MATDLKAQLLDPAYRARLLAIEAAANVERHDCFNDPHDEAIDAASCELMHKARNHFRAALELIGELSEKVKCECGRECITVCPVCDDDMSEKRIVRKARP